MKILFLLSLWLVAVGCVSTEEENAITPLPATELLGAANADERDSIMESVFRHMCQPELVEEDVSHNVNRVHRVYFLGVGDSHDPSPELLKRMGGLSAPAKPMSAGKWRSVFVYDRATGERGAAFYIRTITMISKDEADVEAVVNPGGGKSASGPIYRVTRKNEKWVVTEERLKWIS